jgi:hypothetical protein
VRHTPRAGCATRPARSRRLISTDVIIMSPCYGHRRSLPPDRQSARHPHSSRKRASPHGEPSALPHLILYDSARHAPVVRFA